MKRAMFALVLVTRLSMSQDVRVLFTPESTKSNVLGIRNIGTWTGSIVNYTDRPVLVSAEMIRMAAPEITSLDYLRAKLIVDRAYNRSLTSRGLRLVDFIAPLGLALTGGGLIAADKVTVAAIGLFGWALHRVRDDLVASQPDMAAYLDGVLKDEIALAPFGTKGFSSTFTFYASLMKNVHPVGPIPIYFPVQAPQRLEMRIPNPKDCVHVDGTSGPCGPNLPMQDDAHFQFHSPVQDHATANAQLQLAITQPLIEVIDNISNRRYSENRFDLGTLN